MFYTHLAEVRVYRTIEDLCQVLKFDPTFFSRNRSMREFEIGYWYVIVYLGKVGPSNVKGRLYK